MIVEKIDALPEIKIMDESKHLDDIRQEPPVPVERVIVTDKPVIEKENSVENIAASFAPEIKKIVEKIKTMNDNLNKEPNSVINNNKMIEHVDSITLKAGEDIKVIKSKQEHNEMQKNDNLINSDAIKKEDSEIAAEGEIANMVTVERHEKLRKTLEKHALENLQMLQEQTNLLKDIKEQKREFKRKKERIEKNIDESIQNDSKDNNNNEVNIIQKSNMKEVENINKQSIINKSLDKNKIQKKYITGTYTDKSVLKTPNIRNVNIEIAQDKNDFEQFTDAKNNNNNIQNAQKMKLEEDKDIGQIHSISDYKEKINVKFDDISEKSKGTILSALTKGILIKSTSKDTLFKKKDIRNAQGKQESIINEINKSDEIVMQNQNIMPITLQLKNQTNVNKSEQLTNKSDNDVQLMRRDILENHNREKREITKINLLKAEVSPDVLTEEIKSFMKDVSMDIDRKKCSKTLENSQVEIENMPGKELKQKLEMASIPTISTLIKTNVYLSEGEQELTNTILVDPSITIKGKYIKLKQRDLKALNIDYTRNL